MLKDRGINLPLTMGHETAGEIVAVGPNVKDRKVGEVCLVYPWIGCGECRVCRAGNENLCMKPRCIGVHCNGGYSDHVLVSKSKYLFAAKVVSQTKALSISASTLLRNSPKTVGPTSQLRSARYLASRLVRVKVARSRKPKGARGRLEFHQALSAAC